MKHGGLKMYLFHLLIKCGASIMPLLSLHHALNLEDVTDLTSFYLDCNVVEEIVNGCMEKWDRK